jgi:hypothetical protein
MFVFVVQVQQSVSDLRKFSASFSFSSSQRLLPHIPSRLNTEIEHLDESDGEPNTEEEWLDSAQLAELAHRFPSRMLEAMAAEVLSKHSLYPHTYS